MINYLNTYFFNKSIITCNQICSKQLKIFISSEYIITYINFNTYYNYNNKKIFKTPIQYEYENVNENKNININLVLIFFMLNLLGVKK